MRWMGLGRMMIEGMTILYSGHEDHNIHEVIILLGAETARAMIGWKPVNEHIFNYSISYHTCQRLLLFHM